MPSKYGNTAFYNSKAWRRVSAAYMNSKYYLCERCGAPATICHHKIYLNDVNVRDPEVSLNPENLEALCIDCHNAEHGVRHDVVIFDDQGNVSDVKEAPETRKFQEIKEQIDSVMRKAQSLSVVS